MQRLGSSDLDVFPLVLGTNGFGWTASPQASRAILDAFVAGGGNVIDTADAYSFWVPGNSGGEAESILGDWLIDRANRKRVIVATKVSGLPAYAGLKAANIAAAAEQSLRRLRTDYIDVYYANYDDPDTPLEESVAAFDALVRRGVVRSLGLSNYRAERVQAWIDTATTMSAAPPVSIQHHYNLLVRRAFESTLRPVAAEHGLGVVPYFGLAAGFLTGKYRSHRDADGAARASMVAGYLTDAGFAVVRELDTIASEHQVHPATVALAWLRAQPTIVAPIAGASTPEHVAALLASATLDLTDDELMRLTRVSDAFAAATNSSRELAR
ncbi:MAG TPA: aldo/keto reductase [Solirubrobacteraceae bacterium]